MRASIFLAIFALASSSSATSCNPLTSNNCSPDQALASSFKEDFNQKSKYFSEVKPQGLSYSSDGLKLEIAKRFDNPSIKSDFYIMFGKVEVVMQAAKGKGIISSFYLQSDDLDEIDIELFGGDAYQFQSNWFSKGDTTTYDRGVYHSTSNSPLENFHTYTIEYTKDYITWSLDGDVVRTLKPDNGQGFPQTPMYIMAGTWAGGDPSNEAGTIEWAGGETDYSEAPFDMKIKSVIVVDYSTGSEYQYGDNSGKWTSIKAVDGEVNGRKEVALNDFQTLQQGGSVDSDFLLKPNDISTTSHQGTLSTSDILSSSTTLTKSSELLISSTSSLTTSFSLSASSTKNSDTISTEIEKTSRRTSNLASDSSETGQSFTFFVPSTSTISANSQSTTILSHSSNQEETSFSTILSGFSLSSSSVPLPTLQETNAGSKTTMNFIAILGLLGYFM